MDAPLASQDVLGKRKRGGDRDEDYVNDIDDIDDDLYDNEDNDDDIDFALNDEADIKIEEGVEVPDIAMPEGIDFAIDPDALYHERMEMYPKMAAYDQAVPDVKNTLIGIIQEVSRIIGANPCDNAALSKLAAKAPELLQVPKPQPLKIALLGDTGAGKSSLLNSVIDCPDLARALGGGESCTCVATEYRSAFPEQKKKYGAKVVYFDMESISKLMKELIEGYYIFHFEDGREWDDDTRQQYKRRSETAFKTFRALFSKRDEFKTDAAAAKYLRTMLFAGQKKIVQQVWDWAKEVLEEQQSVQGGQFQYCEADDKRDFSKLVDPMLNSNSQTEGANVWPLIKYVSIGIMDSRVLDNVIIADLPGISDTHQVKVNSTLDYLRSCQAIWIVAPINRIVTSPTLDTLLGKYEERFRGMIAIIATRSDDDVAPALATHLKDKGQNINAYEKLSKQAEKVRGYIAAIKKTISSRMKANNTKERAEKVLKLRKELHKYLQTKKAVHNQRNSILVKGRNAHVTNGILKEFKSYFKQGGKPKIFCVSNNHYLTLKGLGEPASFQLSAEDTGIPALRSYIHELAAPGLLQTLEDYIKHRFTVFVKSVGLWAISRWVPEGDRLLAIIQEPQFLMSTKLVDYRDDLLATTKSSIYDPLTRRAAKHSKDALNLLELKRKNKHWATVRSFMRNNGNHRTSACPKESWNEQFMEGAIHIIGQHWDKVKKYQDKLIEQGKNLLVCDVQNMLATIKADDGAYALELNSFEELISGQLVGITNIFRDHQKDFRQDLANIKLDATQDRHTGYFTQAMQPAYDQCKEDTGAGTVQRCINYMTAQLSLTGDKSPFAQSAKAITDAINGHATERCNIAEQALKAILEDIYDHFDGMMAVEMADPAEKPVRAALKAYLETATVKFEEAQKVLEEAKMKHEVETVAA